MSNPTRRPNSVSRLRSRPNPNASRLIRLGLQSLIVLALVAAATSVFVANREVRAWSAVVAAIAFVAAAVAWLAGKSGTLSGSGRDPRDPNVPL